MSQIDTTYEKKGTIVIQVKLFICNNAMNWCRQDNFNFVTKLLKRSF